MIDSVLEHQNIQVHLGAELTEVKGFVGNFKATIKENGESQELNVGTIIVAVGAQAHKPAGTFGYGRFRQCHDPIGFRTAGRQTGMQDFNRVVIINCVGARNEERSYCGRFCCIVALKNAILLKEANPQGQVTIVQRDVMAVGKLYEDYYRRALEMGVKFVRYDKASLPRWKGPTEKRKRSGSFICSWARRSS